MTTLREAVAQALDALTKIHPGNMSWETGDAWMNAVQILREALAQPEREPVAWAVYDIKHGGSKTLHWPEQHSPNGDPSQFKAVPLYSVPPQRKPLTNGEIHTAYITATNQTLRPQDERLAFAFARAIEQAHGIGDKE
jgi:hypothetical protein